jgi:hypothetical protein
VRLPFFRLPFASNIVHRLDRRSVAITLAPTIDGRSPKTTSSLKLSQKSTDTFP